MATRRTQGAGGRPLERYRTRPWRIRSDRPGRLRVHHPLVARDRIAAAACYLSLAGRTGVEDLFVNRRTSRILVRYLPLAISRDEILGALAAALRDTPPSMEEARRFLAAPEAPSPAGAQLVLSTGNLLFAGMASRRSALAVAARITTLGVAGHIFASALKSLLHEGRLRVDFLDAVAVSLIVAYASVPSAALLVWIVDLGGALLEATSISSRALLAKSFGEEARLARLVSAEGERTVAVGSLRRGDRVAVDTGEPVPVDGVIESGDALVDQHLLTGESAPVDKGAGDPVFAHTSVAAGRVVVRVEETGEATRAARIIALLEASVDQKLRLETLGERFADRMVVPTLALGGIGRWLQGTDAMIAVINADYGTGIRVAAPLAHLAYLSQAVKNAVVIKKGHALEAMRDLDAIVFDKTGTLTAAALEVSEVTPLSAGFDERRVLALAACVQGRLEHPIARAIRARARELEVELPEVGESSHQLGFGVLAEIDGETVRVGSRRFLAREGVEIGAAAAAELERRLGADRSGVLVAVRRRLVGMIGFRSSDRPEARRVIERLRRVRGLDRIYLLSGDHEAVTRSTAERLGIGSFHAEAAPEEKARFIERLQEEGLRVAMVGDGINDTIALASADVSISLSGGADVARDVADVVLMDGTLEKLDLLFDLSDRLHRNVRRGFALVVVPNTLCIAGALAGMFGVGTSLVLNNGFNLLAAINGASPFYRDLDLPPGLADDGERDAVAVGPWLAPSRPRTP